MLQKGQKVGTLKTNQQQKISQGTCKTFQKRMHGITTQIIQLPKLKVFLLLPRLDNKQQVQV